MMNLEERYPVKNLLIPFENSKNNQRFQLFWVGGNDYCLSTKDSYSKTLVNIENWLKKNPRLTEERYAKYLEGTASFIHKSSTTSEPVTNSELLGPINPKQFNRPPPESVLDSFQVFEQPKKRLKGKSFTSQHPNPKSILRVRFQGLEIRPQIHNCHQHQNRSWNTPKPQNRARGLSPVIIHEWNF